jgi:hypothetical protein
MENSGAGANMVINAADQAHGRKPKPDFGCGCGCGAFAWCRLFGAHLANEDSFQDLLCIQAGLFSARRQSVVSSSNGCRPAQQSGCRRRTKANPTVAAQ